MTIRKEAIKRVIEKHGPELLNDPVANASGVAQEVIDDMEAAIRTELKPTKNKRGLRGSRPLASRGRR